MDITPETYAYINQRTIWFQPKTVEGKYSIAECMEKNAGDRAFEPFLGYDYDTSLNDL